MTVSKTFLRNKKALWTTVISVTLLALVIAIVCVISTKQTEKRILEEIEQHIASKEFEYAFDKINSGHISAEDMEKYQEVVIPHIQETFMDVRKSEREDLTLIVDGIEYFISNDKLYTKNNDNRHLLYDASDITYNLESNYMWSYSLDCKKTMYANGCIFFIETHHSSDMTLQNRSELYFLKYLDLNTGNVEVIGGDSHYRQMFKLRDGSIFVQFSYLNHDGKRNPCGGIRYNPYTKSTHEGENVVTAEEIEYAVYKNT